MSAPNTLFTPIIHYALDIEGALIGACLIEQDAFARVHGLVDAEMFFEEKHQAVFRMLEGLFKNGQPVDLLIAVQTAYRQKINEKHPGIAAYLSECCNMVASTANLEQHAMILRQLYLARLLIQIKLSANPDNDALQEVQELEEKLRKARDLSVSNDWENFKDIIIRLRDSLYKPKIPGIHIGINQFDTIADGLQPAEMVVIGARPSVGKTAFACQVAMHVAKSGKNVGIISLEMPNAKLATRMIAQSTQVEYWRIDQHKLYRQQEMDSINRFMAENLHLPIFFSDKTAVNIHDIRAKILKARRTHQLDVVFIDYLGLIEPEKANNREQEISKISRGIKLLAMETGIPVVVLAQLNRETETNKHRPKLSNLRDSGSIEQDADIVMFLHSDWNMGIRQDRNGCSTENKRNLLIAKYRNGRTLDIDLDWDGARMRFEEALQASPEPGKLTDSYTYPTDLF